MCGCATNGKLGNLHIPGHVIASILLADTTSQSQSQSQDDGCDLT